MKHRDAQVDWQPACGPPISLARAALVWASRESNLNQPHDGKCYCTTLAAQYRRFKRNVEYD